MGQVFKEFQDIEFPGWLRERGFVDESWHNDAAPRAVLRIADERQVTVWVDHDDPTEREIPGSTKFQVVVEGEYADSDAVVYGEFDDEAAAATRADLVTLAVKAVTFEYGTEEQISAENEFVCRAAALLDDPTMERLELWYLKATTAEIVNETLKALDLPPLPNPLTSP